MPVRASGLLCGGAPVDELAFTRQHLRAIELPRMALQSGSQERRTRRLGARQHRARPAGVPPPRRLGSPASAGPAATTRRLAPRHGVIGLIDQTCVVKKGTKTPGVQRQSCGAVGKIEHVVRLAKGEVRLSYFEGRRDVGLMRHMILRQTVLLFLAEQARRLACASLVEPTSVSAVEGRGGEAAPHDGAIGRRPQRRWCPPA